MALMGLTQDRPLLVWKHLEHAAVNHARTEIVSRMPATGDLHRTTYKAVYDRARKVSAVLQSWGIQHGDRVGTLAWNTYRHLECFYGAAGHGAVIHTVNPRLHPEDIAYIINHGEDRALFIDLDFVPIVEGILGDLKTVEHFVVLCAKDEMPETTLPNALAYEELLAEQPADHQWQEFDESQAVCLCYTSGTTGKPKGVLASNRAMTLHALSELAQYSINAEDTVLAIAPIYHGAAWWLTYSVPISGAKFVLPGKHMDGEHIYDIMDREKVTLAAAVPTVWTMLTDFLQKTGKRLESLNRTIIGGTAVAPAMRDYFRDTHGVKVLHTWGMTEVGLATAAVPSQPVLDMPEAERQEQLLKQGRPFYGLEMKIVDDDGKPIPRDGEAFGAIWVRGLWVAAGYFKGDGGDVLDDEGFFPTGDVGTWDDLNYLKITDRTKDVIKSGGEWISSIELENAAMAHPEVLLAAAVAVPHPKWDERPLLVIKPVEGATPTRDAILDFMKERVAKWWLPDDVVFVEEMPLTATGKIRKLDLRQIYEGHLKTAAD